MSAHRTVAPRRRCGLAAAIVAAIVAAAAAAPGAPVAVTAVDSIGITVSNLERSVAFFQDVLSFALEGEFEAAGRAHELLTGVFGARTRTARLLLGDEHLELTEFLAPRGRDFPADTRGNDVWFQHIAIITSDMDAAYARLRAHGAAHASTGPQRLPEWNRNAAGIDAFYFRDPDGHFLEVLRLPPGKGSPRWQQHDRLFLGIDHTAIVSSDTERSLRFYRDGLGMRVVGESENYGEEQEHLNNVFGARLRITTLHAADGPGVELLEYLAPRDGRPAPRDLRANDLAHWQTTLVARGAGALLQSMFGGWLVSPDLVAPAGGGFARGLLVRDPDGHGLRIVER